MDLAKIGKFIAGKRKSLGMTQKQLAEKIGMSDKSVSKWERGVCLPDVSIYLELCDILGITINEFLAGEDISEENILKKSEDNLICVTNDSKNKQNQLKKAIALLLFILLVAGGTLGFIIYHYFNRPQNYVAPIARESAEMKTAELLSSENGVFLFRYSLEDEIKKLTVYMYEYRFGKLIEKEKTAEFIYDDVDAATEGMIALVPDFEKSTVRLIVADNMAKYSEVFPILDNEKNKTSYGTSVVYIEETTPVEYGKEQGIAALLYGEKKLRLVPIQQIESGEIDSVNDYVYYFSIEFHK